MDNLNISFLVWDDEKDFTEVLSDSERDYLGNRCAKCGDVLTSQDKGYVICGDCYCEYGDDC